MKPSKDAPARRTRPRNRRAITLAAAAKLFHRHGYSSVAMSDIADMTNVSASAIYRHFPGKADLLVEAIRAGLARYIETLSGAPTSESTAQARLLEVLARLAECAIDHRELGVLWQRDARNLDDEQQRSLREEMRAGARLLSSFIADARPGLGLVKADVLAWCAFGVLVSLGFHSLTLPRPEFTALLVELVSTVAFVDMPDEAAPRPLSSGNVEPPESRREQLITVATELFAERGFSAVGVDDIAQAVGIAGPSIYAHFPSKLAILTAAIDRATLIVQRDTGRVLASGNSPAVKLARLVDSYTGIANQDRYVLRTLMSEMDRLPEHDREIARRVQREYIDTWVGLVRQSTAEAAVPARIRVQAVLLVVNDAVQTPHLRSRRGFEQTLKRIANALLGA